MRTNQHLTIALLCLLCFWVGGTALALTSGSDSRQVRQVAQQSARITEARAKEIALKSQPGAKVEDCKIKKEDGRLIYSVELDSGVEVNIDANDGHIVSTESPEQDSDKD